MFPKRLVRISSKHHAQGRIYQGASLRAFERGRSTSSTRKVRRLACPRWTLRRIIPIVVIRRSLTMIVEMRTDKLKPLMGAIPCRLPIEDNARARSPWNEDRGPLFISRSPRRVFRHARIFRTSLPGTREGPLSMRERSGSRSSNRF